MVAARPRAHDESVSARKIKISGDTLFRGSCGRVDLEDGDLNKMIASLNRLGKLKQDYEVYPGHGESSTLDRERRFNQYMIYAAEKK